MTEPKLRRRPPPLLQALAWFVPGWVAVAIAAASTHPLVLIPLLLANALTMAAVCHAIGFDPEPRFGRTVLRRGAATRAVPVVALSAGALDSVCAPGRVQVCPEGFLTQPVPAAVVAAEIERLVGGHAAPAGRLATA